MMIRILIFSLTTLMIASCKKQLETKVESESQHIIENTFATCFSNIDTTKVGRSIGCSAGIYKLIDDQYVVHIVLDFPVQLDTCFTIYIDSLNGKQMTELLVFDNKDASLTNTCTDVLMVNHPEPSRTLYAQSGQLSVAFSDAAEYYGNRTHHSTILIKKLVFVDNTGKTIELENELLWKVLDLGTPVENKPTANNVHKPCWQS